jgi:hypothetical protein
MIRSHEDDTAIAPVTSSIMVHNIELMMDRRPPLTPAIETFLRENPVTASELVNLPRYKRRLAALGYISPSTGIN